MPYKYLYRHLDGLGLKAVIVRPGLIDWNAISRKHTLDQLLEEIGEPVYRYQRKESAKCLYCVTQLSPLAEKG